MGYLPAVVGLTSQCTFLDVVYSFNITLLRHGETEEEKLRSTVWVICICSALSLLYILFAKRNVENASHGRIPGLRNDQCGTLENAVLNPGGGGGVLKKVLSGGPPRGYLIFAKMAPFSYT